jgi:hypothetical protein
MTQYDWSNEKNELLKKVRGVSFEDVVLRVEQGDLLDIIEHPNQVKYPGQQMLIINIHDYAYLVPFVEKDNERFLKTIIPSRRATNKYLGGP